VNRTALIQKLRNLTSIPIVELHQWVYTLDAEFAHKLLIARENDLGLYDPIEDDPKIASHITAIRLELSKSEEIKNDNNRLSTHKEWAILKELLKSRHGVDWKTPLEMNPWMRINWKR
jgi:hypothetical protein